MRRMADDKAREAFHEVRRSEILDAATSVLVRKGAEATMQDFAAAVGLTAGALYRYYASKEDLVDAILAECARRNAELFDEAEAHSASPLEGLIAAGASAWAGLREEDRRERSALHLETALAAYRREDNRAGTRMAGIWRDLIGRATGLVRQAQQRGELDTSIDAATLGLTLIAAHQGLVLLSVSLGQELDTDGVFDLLERMVRALAPEKG